MSLPIPYPERDLADSGHSAGRDESSLRSLLCHIGRQLHDAAWLSGTGGSLSARLDAKYFLLTPPQLAKGFLQPDQLLKIALDDALGAQDGEPLLHALCYQQRADLNGILFATPPHAVALTLANVSMRTCVLPEAIILLGLVPTAAYSTPFSAEQCEAVRVLIVQHDALLIAHSGALTAGTDLWEAFLRMEVLEHTATVLQRAAQLAPLPTLPPHEVARLLHLRRQRGYWREGDAERFCQMCGVC
ncbi:MAG: class II aldolase/adducin family protein [Anaerolineae bacterium]|nr:class II aldolase/adducin family protein [Anaerolineae bacterium]MDW8300155.1 class II aldolase/adducin family protein [Anaerolineae bacterium]